MSRQAIVIAIVSALLGAAALAAAFTSPARAGVWSSAIFQVQISGPGSGSVMGPAGTCHYDGVAQSGACSSEEPVPDSPLVYTAQAAPGSTFAGWIGCSSVAGPVCTVDREGVESEVVTVKALFAKALGKITVTPPVGGSVHGPGINCGSGNGDCEQEVPLGNSVVLSVAPAAGYVFKSWGHACAATTSANCLVVVSGAVHVSAVFQPVASTPGAPPAGGIPVVEKCDCDELELSMMPRPFASGQMKAGRGLVDLWFKAQLTCTDGVGANCAGTFDVAAPQGFRVTKMHFMNPGKKPGTFTRGKRITDDTISCKVACAIGSETFYVRVRMRTNADLDRYVTDDLRIRVATSCAENVDRKVFRLLLTPSWGIDRAFSDLNGDGKPDRIS